MGRAYYKTVFATVRDNVGRFLAILAIIALGVAFVGGLGTLSEKMENTLSENMIDQRVADLIVKGRTQAGVSRETVQALAAAPGVEAVEAFTMLDLEQEGRYYRVYLFDDLSALSVNTLQLQQGRAVGPLEGMQVEGWAERPSVVMDPVGEGDVVSLSMYGLPVSVHIVGVVGNPLITFRGGEPNQLQAAEGVEAGDITPLSDIFYLDKRILLEQFGLSELPFPVTDVWVKGENTQSGGDLFDASYLNRVNALKAALAPAIADADVEVLTLEQNASYQVVRSYSKKIRVITMIFPVFFIVVAALVVLTTLTRMTEEERGMIGCYKTLGFSDGAVLGKYMGFSGLCCLAGSALGLLLGLTAVPAAIFPAFHSILFLSGEARGVSPTAGLVAASCTTAVVLLVTFGLLAAQLVDTPAALLQPKAPKPGKVIWLEKIKWVWEPLPFRYKSTLRNLFRHKRHLIMTVISVVGSTALVLAGFGLMDVWSDPDAYAFGAGMEQAFTAISVVVILFAVALCVLVVFNLTNMNIGERKREIATLKVLGYHDLEVAGYIYREIFLMAVLGIPLGLLLGFFLLMFAFSYLEFGSVANIKWYSYLLAALLVVVTVGLVDLLLFRKLRNVDMTSSLKTVE